MHAHVMIAFKTASELLSTETINNALHVDSHDLLLLPLQIVIHIQRFREKPQLALQWHYSFLRAGTCHTVDSIKLTYHPYNILYLYIENYPCIL